MWFYTLHVLATALFDRPAFSSCVSHGIVLGSDGQKMSKSLKNYPDVTEVCAATSVMGSGSVNDSAEPRLAELALLVVVVDEEGQGGAVGCRGVLEHLQVPSRVAGGEDRAPAQLGLNGNWAGRVLLSTVLVGGTRGEGAAGKAPPEPADRLRWRLLTGWPRH